MAGKHRKGGEVDPAALETEAAFEAGVAAPAALQTASAAPARAHAAPQAGVSLLPEQPADFDGSTGLAATAGAAVSGAAVVPGYASARRAVREERRRGTRRTRVVAAVVAVVVVLAGVVFVTSHRGSGAPAAAGPAARTQQTLLLQVVDAHQVTLASVLLSHDAASGGTSFGALIPASLLVNSAGLGSGPLAQTSVGQGPTVGAEAVADAVGITVDGGWDLPVSGLAALVDSVGGVDVNVDEDIQQATASGGTAVLIPAGQHHLGGQLAATYATFLDAGSPEQQRLARLSTVLAALIAKLPSGAAPIAALVSGLATTTTSTLPAARVAAFLNDVRADAVGGQLSFDNLPTHVLDAGGVVPTLLLDNNALPAFVKANFANSQPTNAAGAPFSVLVQNGVGTPGLDEKARRKLAAQGVGYLDGANASSFGNLTSTVLIADGGETAQRQGALVAKALGLPTSDIKITDQGQNLAAVVVVLGADFKP
jgi:polyisoprenyl-teichoic acid--peptidoglycan teichoic acid transferase